MGATQNGETFGHSHAGAAKMKKPDGGTLSNQHYSDISGINPIFISVRQRNGISLSNRL